MESLDVLISTCNGRLSSALRVLQPEREGIHYVIVHQQFDASDTASPAAIDEASTRSDITYIRISSKGLSLSRNTALTHAQAPLVLFADDDITFEEDAFDSVRRQFEQYQIDFCAFRFQKHHQNTLLLAKRYPASGCKVTPFNAFRVSSVELAVRREELLKNNIAFDERFGLGTDLPGSEEIIFVSDCLKKGLTGQHCDKIILTHPEESSGDTWTPANASARGALFRRVFGYKGIVLLIPFLWRHRKRISANQPFSAMCRLAIRTFFSFKP